MGLEDPTKTKIRNYGYAQKEPETIGKDYFGVEILEGDNILEFGDKQIVLDEATKIDLIELLVDIGASKSIAKK